MVTVGTHATPSSCSNTTLAWPGTAPPWPSNTTQAWDTRYSPAPQPRYPWEPYAKYPLTPAMTAPPPALQRWQHPHIDKVAHVRAYHRLREKARGLDSIAFAAVVAAVGVWLSGANPRPQMPVIMLQLYRAALPWLPTCCYWLSALLVLRAMLMLLRWKKRDLEWMPAHKRLSAQSQVRTLSRRAQGVPCLCVQEGGKLRAKFSRRVASKFAVNSDAAEYCKFRFVQRCTGRRQGTKMCLFPSRAHHEISGTIQSPPGYNIKPQDSGRCRNFPLPKFHLSKLSPGKPLSPPVCMGGPKCTSLLCIFVHCRKFHFFAIQFCW